MAVSSLNVIKDRIRSATQQSKIAIFVVRQGKQVEFDAMFDDTVVTIRRLRKKDKNYIGSYYGSKGAEYAEFEMSKVGVN